MQWPLWPGAEWSGVPYTQTSSQGRWNGTAGTWEFGVSVPVLLSSLAGLESFPRVWFTSKHINSSDDISSNYDDMDDHQWCLLQFSVIFSRVSLSISDSDKVWKQILWVVSITSAAKMFHDGHAQKYEESSTRLSCVKNGLRDCELINNNRPLDWQKKISFYLAATLDLLIPVAKLL